MPESQKRFYITTTLPYVNAEPHVGFAAEIIRADIIARWRRLNGDQVFFNTGTDEHGAKIHQKARSMSLEPQAYVDGIYGKFVDLLAAVGAPLDMADEGFKRNFIRTTDPHHVMAAQEFWKTVDKNGYIYKKDYSIKYCIGCELEKTESELVNGRCPLHPLQELEIIHEENYFFRFSSFKEKLLALYAAAPGFVVPNARFNEIKAFIERGPEDFSISRLASKMPWGIPVPNDPEQVMYVWFDALVDYISAIGWPDRLDGFQAWWVETGGVVQYCGKDNLRQQAAMWQAMLMAAGLPPSKAIVVDGFITGDGGVKMSKSLGNTIDPFDIVKTYGTDALRYYAARELSPFEDSPFTVERFKEAYNASLANGIGNLTSRILKLTSTYGISSALRDKESIYSDETARAYAESMAAYDIRSACEHVWARISAMDGEIQAAQPFKLLKSEAASDIERGKAVLAKLYAELWVVAVLLEPIMPHTAEAIQSLVKSNSMPEAPLFMRI
ncbi:MAG: methionine--tRNA ligase [Patescibacteria group bacterium]|nr:methionine--tRNA ligase [Patescibacteria group bacterium]